MKLADFGLSRTVEKSGNDLSLFHARWTAPEVWDDYIDDDDYTEGEKIVENSLTVPFNFKPVSQGKAGGGGGGGGGGNLLIYV